MTGRIDDAAMRTNRRHVIAGMAALGALSAMPASAQEGDAPMVPEEPGPTVSQAWGAAVAGLTFAALPAEVVERTKWCLLDSLVVLGYGARLPASDIYLGRAIAAGGAPEARIPVRAAALPVTEAAACNAYLIHAIEIDDNDFRGSYRPSCVALPAPLAVANWKRSSGQALLTAAAIAYTLTGRLAAMAPNMQRYGFMPSAIFGGVGGAAAAAHLMRLDAERTGWAIGLAAGGGGGLFQYYLDQTEDKKLHVARTARTSVEMAIMAERGFIGPHRAIEGAAGMNGYLQGRPIRMKKGPLIESLAAWEGPLHIVPKFFACSASIGPFLDALDPVWRASGARPADVAGFTIARDWAKEGIAARKIVDFHPPETITGAQLDMAYSIALYLLTGDAGPGSFTEARLKDPTILALADRAQFRETPKGAPIAIEVVLKDGRTIAAPFTYPRGDVPQQPLMREARLKKIERLTAGILDDRGRQRLFDMVMTVDRAPDMREWLAEAGGLLRGR